MLWFPSQGQNCLKNQNLLFLTISVQVELYKRKPGNKEEKLRKDFMMLYLRNHEKMSTSWLIFCEDKKKEARWKCWTLRRIFWNLAARPTRKDWPRTLSLRCILGKLSLKSWRGLKTLWFHIKWVQNWGHFPCQKPIKRCWTEAEFRQETLSALRQKRPFLSMF